MKNSKLVKVLSVLTPSEFRQFYRYIRSPFFTQSEDALRLYEYIRKYYPTFESKKLERQFVFTKLFPKQKFNGAKFSSLLLKLTKILEDYLIFLKFQQNEFEKKKVLTQIYGERNIHDIFKQKTTELLEELEQQPYRGADFFYSKYFLQQDYYLNVHTPKQGNTFNLLKDAIESLESFFSLEYLRLGIDLKNRERIFSECHDFEVTPQFNSLKNQNILYSLLRKSICLLETNNEAIFFQIKNNFLENIEKIPPNDCMTIFQILLNFAMQQLPIAEEKYINEVFGLLKIGVSTKLLFSNTKITDQTFLNVVMTGAKLREFEYVEQFIVENGQYLAIKNSVDVIRFAKSYLHFTKKEYEQVIDLLKSFTFSSILIKINAKLLLIRTYYHISEKDSTYLQLVQSNCEAFEKFVLREKQIHPLKKEAINNFIFLLKKVIKYQRTNKRNPTRKKELNHLLNNFAQIINRSWIKVLIDQF